MVNLTCAVSCCHISDHQQKANFFQHDDLQKNNAKLKKEIIKNFPKLI